MLSFFFILCFLCLVGRLLPFFCRSSLLGVAVENIFGSELLFLGVGVGLVFFSVVFCTFWRFAPETVWKNSLDVRPAFFGFVLSLVLRRRRLCFCLFFLLRDTAQVVTGHPHTHLCLLFLFSFLSRRTCFIARFGRASCFLVVFRGATLGPARGAFLGFSWNSRGLSELTRPFRGLFSWDARRQGCFGASLVLVFLFPFLFCFAATPFLDARVGDLAEVG